MRAVLREIENVLVIAAGSFLGFIVGFLLLIIRFATFLVIAAGCLALGLLSFIALLEGVLWLFTHRAHELRNAAEFLCAAAAVFAVLVPASLYRDRLMSWPARRQARLEAERLGRIRLQPRVTTDASFFNP